MAPTIRTVASYNTHQEHTIDFFGTELTVTVTPTASVIRRWINHVRTYNRHPYSSQPLVVGISVQWTSAVSQYADPSPAIYNGIAPWNSYYADPPPHRYYDDPPPHRYYDDPPPHRYYADNQTRSYCVDPPPDTLQLCVGKNCLIIQLSHCDSVPDELRNFLADPETTFVCVWNGQDARKLAESRHRLEIGKLVDLRNYIQDSEGRSVWSPDICMSDWSVYDLSHEQILQASLDVYVCYELGVWLRLWEV